MPRTTLLTTIHVGGRAKLISYKKNHFNFHYLYGCTIFTWNKVPCTEIRNCYVQCTLCIKHSKTQCAFGKTTTAAMALWWMMIHSSFSLLTSHSSEKQETHYKTRYEDEFVVRCSFMAHSLSNSTATSRGMRKQ